MVTNNHFRWDFVGLSTDTKPTPDTSPKVVDGSTFYCSDTSKLYVFCKTNWYERKPLGGGGASYTAGDGITIADDTISVDTTTIQEKLTAGSGIDITDNTISTTGGGVTPVQTTGTSTSDVMSQNAVTQMIFPKVTQNPYIVEIGRGSIDTIAGTYSVGIGGSHYARGDYSVAIGAGASVYGDGNSSVAVGRNAKTTNYSNSVALGAYSTPLRNGEVNVGTGGQNQGFNNSDYRVIGGVHDGQLAQDAVTVNQVNSVIDAINTALSTNISHIGA